jgi:fumarate hydratase subunit alpha
MVREVGASAIAETVARLFQEAACDLPEDVEATLRFALEREESPRGRRVLQMLLQNAELARKERMPLCQDTGTAVIFLEIGQDVRIGGDLNDALNLGVAKGYKDGFLRMSMVRQPFSRRLNTGDNTPPVVHLELVPGDKVKIVVLPKGGGCENMSRLAILKPSEGKQGVIDFVVRAVEDAGGNPCPPIIVGVGIGGTAEHAMLIAKKALLRKVGEHNTDAETAELERELLKHVNATGLGPMAWGGRITALAVHVETYPTHITSLPVGVNFQCHSARTKTAVL